LRSVKAWVAAAFQIQDGVYVTVSEVACGMPGCPPLETVIGLFEGDRQPRQFKLYKPVLEVTQDDVFVLANLSSAMCECCVPNTS
jgi:nitrate reductase delta subunit